MQEFDSVCYVNICRIYHAVMQKYVFKSCNVFCDIHQLDVVFMKLVNNGSKVFIIGIEKLAPLFTTKQEDI